MLHMTGSDGLAPVAEARVAETSDFLAAAKAAGLGWLDRKIELLREYRTRLVADVVTGKLDVRPVACHLPVEPIAPTPEESTEPEEAEA